MTQKHVGRQVKSNELVQIEYLQAHEVNGGVQRKRYNENWNP